MTQRATYRARVRAMAGLGGALALCLSAPVMAQEAAQFFRQSCASCHTIGGGRLVGPDLKNVTQRKDRPWLLKFINNPKGVLASGDAYALKLKEEAGGAMMIPIAGMTPERAEAMLQLIEAESALPKSQFAGLQISDQPFSPADIQQGRDLFRGAQRLQNGGAACISCHTTVGLGGLSGGRLGPDLSKVYERMMGRKALASWLQAPATPTMQQVFGNRALSSDEIVPLVAYFEDTARRGGEDDGSAQVIFFVAGLGLAVVGLALADGAWRNRLRSVRRILVRGER